PRAQLAGHLLPDFGLRIRPRHIDPVQTQAASLQTLVMAGHAISIQELTLARSDRRLARRGWRLRLHIHQREAKRGCYAGDFGPGLHLNPPEVSHSLLQQQIPYQFVRSLPNWKNDLLCAWFLLDVYSAFESNHSKSQNVCEEELMVRESGSRVFATHVIHAALICAGLLLLAPAGSWSQANSATLHGTVNDPTGAVVPGVTVTLTNQNTGAAMVQSTAERGDFTFTFVPVGVYTVRVEAPGFKARTVTGITLTAGQQARQTFTIELGSVA